MTRQEYASIGGGQRSFQTTHWTAIEQVRAGPSSCARALVGELLQACWKPVYSYLRHRGFDNEEAKDLTQDFFQEIVLGRAPAELCAAHWIEEPTRASNMIFAVKRRFQSALKRHLRQSVACDAQVGPEIRALPEFLIKPRQ